MPIELLVIRKVEREEFNMVDYIPSDHIFALVAKGSFKFTAEGKSYTVSRGEGALFKKDVLYHREIIDRAVMYLFRYRSESPVFQKLKITFKDIERVRSTLSLLESLDTRIFKNDFEYRTRLFFDLVTQYEIENGSDVKSSRDPIDVAIEQINSSNFKEIKLAEISTLTGLSYIQFIRRFKKKTGMTPREYIKMP